MCIRQKIIDSGIVLTFDTDRMPANAGLRHLVLTGERLALPEATLVLQVTKLVQNHGVHSSCKQGFTPKKMKKMDWEDDYPCNEKPAPNYNIKPRGKKPSRVTIRHAMSLN